MNLLLLETVYSVVLNGDNSFAKYFARWYVAALTLEIIGHIDNLSMPSPSESLWSFGYSIEFSWRQAVRIYLLKLVN